MPTEETAQQTELETLTSLVAGKTPEQLQALKASLDDLHMQAQVAAVTSVELPTLPITDAQAIGIVDFALNGSFPGNLPDQLLELHKARWHMNASTPVLAGQPTWKERMLKAVVLIVGNADTMTSHVRNNIVPPWIANDAQAEHNAAAAAYLAANPPSEGGNS